MDFAQRGGAREVQSLRFEIMNHVCHDLDGVHEIGKGERVTREQSETALLKMWESLFMTTLEKGLV
jgi:hypothetical protein